MAHDEGVSTPVDGGMTTTSPQCSDATFLKTIAGFFLVALAISAAVDSTAKKLTGPIGEIISTMAKLAEPLVRLAIDWKRCEVFEQAGWLPHYTSPLDLADDHINSLDGVNEKLESFYRANWTAVEASFISMLEKYGIDDQAKEVFRQSLGIHASGSYSLVPRALFPELERLSRVQFGKGPLETVTSQHDLIQLAGELPLSAAYPGGLYVLKLFERLVDHLYAKVTHQNLKQIAADPVPNRHATMHGFVSYNSYRSSLNALVMTDYIFQLLSTAKNDQVALAVVTSMRAPT